MGYRTQNYTRDTLRKIALPGNAASTLFWVVPLGNWDLWQIEKLWRHFTETPGACNDVGLLIVRDDRKEREARKDQKAGGKEGGYLNLDDTLSKIKIESGNLADLVPEAVNHGGNNLNDNTRSLLVLSGAFPQPGWGVIIPLTQQSTLQYISSIFEKSVNDSCSQEEIDIIKSAAKSHERRNERLNKKPVEPVDAEISQLAEIANKLRIIVSSVEDVTTENLNQILNLFTPMALGEKFGMDDFVSSHNEIREEIKVLNIPNLLNSNDCTLHLFDTYQKCEDKVSFLRQLNNRQNQFLNLMNVLQRSDPTFPKDKLAEWIQTSFKDHLLKRLKAVFEPKITEIERMLAERRVKHQLEINLFEKKKSEWVASVRNEEIIYRRAISQAATVQWNTGPKFLVNLENICVKNGFSAKSVAWDSARMIGWKLHVKNFAIGLNGLWAAANNLLAPEKAPKPSGDFSGSLFADYVYYLVSSSKNSIHREFTKNLLTELLTVDQFIKCLPNKPYNGETREELAEVLLKYWGWKKPSSSTPQRSLADCIAIKQEKLTLSHSYLDVRVSLESFLKDITRITFSTLGGEENQLTHLVAIHCVNYQRNPRKTTWKNEINGITSGAARVLLTGLLPLAFPNVYPAVLTSFLDLITKITQILNIEAHDNNEHAPAQHGDEEVANWINQILELSDQIVGEMPWHLRPTQSFGLDPSVICGEAWCHRHKAKREIRVLIWGGDTNAPELLVWNQSRVNPVMTDATLL